MDNKRFSISLNCELSSLELAFDLFHCTCLDGVELPTCYLNNPKLPELIEKSNMHVSNVIDLVSPSISRRIIEQTPKVQKDVFEHIDSIIQRQYDFSFNSVTLDLGFDTGIGNKENLRLKTNFLKQFIHTLFTKDITMTLPVRIPDAIPLSEYVKHILEVVHNTMSKAYKLCLNVYPHEAGKNEKPDEIYYWYDFDLKTIRIVYEPETGNYITKKLLEYWITPLDEIDFKGDVIFCPQTNNFSLFENEVKKLTDLINKMDL